MKKSAFMVIFLLGFGILIQAQDMPSWTRMGMNLLQIRQNTSKNQWYEQTSNHNGNDYVFFKYGENAGIYLFTITPQKGLVRITIMPGGNIPKERIADFLSRKYGRPNFSDVYIWTENLPENVVYLGIDDLNDGNFAIRYVFRNYLD
jgi:hypothetical protein